jgi:hypothetical protein
MIRLALITALSVLGLQAGAHAQSVDGCVRLPSSGALVIVIPKTGCGIKQMAEARNEVGPTLVYGITPLPVAETVAASGAPTYVQNNNTNVGVVVSKRGSRARHGH